MKKETDGKKDNNQAVWEEFISKNKIKKNYSSGGNLRFNVVNQRASNAFEEFKSHPKADIKTQPLERKNYFGLMMKKNICIKEIGLDQLKEKVILLEIK